MKLLFGVGRTQLPVFDAQRHCQASSPSHVAIHQELILIQPQGTIYTLEHSALAQSKPQYYFWSKYFDQLDSYIILTLY